MAKEPTPSAIMKIEFNEEQVKLIKDTVAPDATDTELQLFLYQAKRTGLDPLARQLYFLKRNVKVGNEWKKKVSIQTSIDGFRVIAERNGSYAGQSEPEFEEAGATPKLCKVRVYRFGPNGERYEASVGVAYWNEYVPQSGQDFMWRKMPHTMIAKVAEALALRKAFPQDLSGIYTEEEMAQAEAPKEPATATGVKVEPETAKRITKKSIKSTKIKVKVDAKKSEPIQEGEVVEVEPPVTVVEQGEVKEYTEVPAEPKQPGTIIDGPARQAKLKWVKSIAQSGKIPEQDFDAMTLEQLTAIMDGYLKSIGKK